MYIGIAVMVIAIIASVAAVIAFHFANKQLKQQLETEYGKKRH